MGYATGQFGKNHLGDLNQFLPTVHGFDEFFGYLYHLDAMEDPCHRNYPQKLKATVGPRNMLHTWATDMDDPTVQPRWGKIGKQKIEDAGELCPEADGDGRRRDSRQRAQVPRQGEGRQQAVLPLAQSDAHARRHASVGQVRKHAQLRERLVAMQEAGMAQLDDIVGSVMKYLKDNGLDDEHDRRLHHRQRRRELHLARRRPDAVRRRQGNGAGRRLPRRR